MRSCQPARGRFAASSGSDGRGGARLRRHGRSAGRRAARATAGCRSFSARRRDQRQQRTARDPTQRRPDHEHRQRFTGVARFLVLTNDRSAFTVARDDRPGRVSTRKRVDAGKPLTMFVTSSALRRVARRALLTLIAATRGGRRHPAAAPAAAAAGDRPCRSSRAPPRPSETAKSRKPTARRPTRSRLSGRW